MSRVEEIFCEDVLPSAGCHDAAFSITFAVVRVMIHAQVMAHLMGHHSGNISQTVVAEL